ncbi:MAG: hypothetical protein ACYCQL_00715 [Acidithiobacillus sp.]
MKTKKETIKQGRAKDVVRGLSWRIVTEGEAFPRPDREDDLCIPNVCMPGFEKEKMRRAREGAPIGFFCVSNMSQSAPFASRKVTINTTRTGGQTPVFFQLTFNVQVNRYAKGDAMDWDHLTYLQAYHLYKNHLSAIWDRVAASNCPGRDDLLKYSNLHDALADDPLLAITTLWWVFPTLQAVTWDLPVDEIPRFRGLAIRDASLMEQAVALAPVLGNISGDWRFCENTEISDWPQF